MMERYGPNTLLTRGLGGAGGEIGGFAGAGVFGVTGLETGAGTTLGIRR